MSHRSDVLAFDMSRPDRLVDNFILFPMRIVYEDVRSQPIVRSIKIMRSHHERDLGRMSINDLNINRHPA